MRLAISAALFLAMALPGDAAQIEVREDMGKLPVIGVLGNIEGNDVARFQELSSTLSNAIVLLKSGGGKMAPAIQIGELVKAKGYTTVVSDFCASSCALIWLAGSKRFMTPTARIGLHQAYNGTGQADGPGNAILGSYLTRLGLSYSAIVFATQARPNDMKWLTVDDAKRIGIPVVVLGLNTLEKPSTP
jgi:hypothetical protein